MTLATSADILLRLKPTSSIAKPACMNRTKQAATITHTVSAATPAAGRGGVIRECRTGAKAASSAIPEARPSSSDETSVWTTNVPP